MRHRLPPGPTNLSHRPGVPLGVGRVADQIVGVRLVRVHHESDGVFTVTSRQIASRVAELHGIHASQTAAEDQADEIATGLRIAHDVREAA